MTELIHLLDVETSTETTPQTTNKTTPQTTTEPTKPKRTRKSKFATEAERHASILRSKRNYYARNAELYRLKSLQVYYTAQLAREDLDENKKDKYERKLRELIDKIHVFVNSPAQSLPSDSSSSSSSSESDKVGSRSASFDSVECH